MTQAKPEPGAARPFARLALIGIVLYVAIDVALGFLRPDYSLLKNYESDYGRGPFAWLMDLNFVLRGLLTGLAVVALRRAGIARRWTAALMWVWAGASALLALFPDNPAGYPREASGGIHLLLAGIAFIAIAIATVGMSFRRNSFTSQINWLRALAVAGVVALVFVVHSFGVPGLFERLFLVAEIGWLTVGLSIVMRRR
jgi:hypothetical membrane protein